MTQPDAPLERLQRELQAKEQALNDFTFTVSHDLKANLRHIKAYLGILREDMGERLQPEWLGYFEVVEGAAQRMQQQIDGLITLSNLSAQTPHTEPLSMAALVQEARQQLLHTCAGREVVWQVADDFPVLMGDPSMVRQVWVHLLHNALKFTRACEVAHINVGWVYEDARVWCFVQDNGVGFPASQSDQLFKVFRKLHAGDEGLGLGLALARQSVERQGGRVRAQALSGPGAWFGFHLPSKV